MPNIVSEYQLKYDKYKSILDLFDPKHHDILIEIFDKTIIYLKTKHLDKDKEEKTSAVYVVKECWKRNPDFKISEIEKIIDEFLDYRQGLTTFMNNLAMMQIHFDAEIAFYDEFVTKQYEKIKI